MLPVVYVRPTVDEQQFDSGCSQRPGKLGNAGPASKVAVAERLFQKPH